MCSLTNQKTIDRIKSAGGSDNLHVSFNQTDLWVSPPSECTQSGSELFIQYTCVMSETQQYNKYRGLCVVVALSTLIGCVYYLMVRYTSQND